MPDRRPMTTQDLWELPRVGPPAADPAGDVVVAPVTTTDPEGTATTTLWRIDGDEPIRLTTTASAGAPAVAPDGSAVAFVRAVDGRAQAHVLPLAGGEARQVTDLPLGITGGVRWAGPDHLLVVTRLLTDDPTLDATAAWRDEADDRPPVLATERRLTRAWDTWYVDPVTQHVLLVDARGEADPRDLTPGEWVVPDPLTDPASLADLSPDGRTLAWTTADPDGDGDGVPVTRLRVVEVDGGEVRELTADVAGHVGAPRWLPDGRIAVTVSRERDFYAAVVDVVAIDPDGGGRQVLLDGEDLDLGVLGMTVDPRGGLVLSTEVRGRFVLLHLSADGGVEELPLPDAGGLAQPVATLRGVWALHSSFVDPPEVALVDAGTVTSATSFTSPLRDELDLGEVEQREVVGGNGDPVQVWLLHPPTDARDGDGDGPPPMVHLVHGGPHGAFGDHWHWRWCAARWAAEGWVVAAVNFHGSTGFGHAWTRSIHGDWATLPTQDVEATTDALVADGTVDGDRVAIAGGSYGGYLVTWLTAVTDRYRASVAHAAVTDFGGMYASDWTSGLADAFGGTWWEDPVATHAASPSWRYGEISTPTLVLHGERDLRVPIDQGRALYGVLQARRVPSRLVVMPQEHHWVLSRRTNEAWYGEVLDWLHRHLDG